MRKLVFKYHGDFDWRGSQVEEVNSDWFQKISTEELINYCRNWCLDEDCDITIFENGVAIYDIIFQEPMVVDLKKENPDNGTE